MFFIVPDQPHTDSSTATSNTSNTVDPSSKRKRLDESFSSAGTYYPKRTPKACDRCRIKKAKCTGGDVCGRCRQDGVVCITRDSSKPTEKPVDPAYLHLVESQRDALAKALHSVMQHQPQNDLGGELEETLAKIGLPLNHLRGTSARMNPTVAELSSDLQSSDTWNEVFEGLGYDQLMQIESLAANSPSPQDKLLTTYGEFNEGQNLCGMVQEPETVEYGHSHLDDVSYWSSQEFLPTKR